MTAEPLIIAAATSGWTGSDLALRLGVPVVLVVVGLLVFVWGRTLRAQVLEQGVQRGGFGGPPGTTDVGSAEGFGVEEARATLESASRRVLAGLGLMLLGSLSVLGVIGWRLLS
jgi:hypothetical protein